MLSKQHEPGGSGFLEKPLIRLAQKISRRSFVGTAAGALMGAVGIVVIERPFPPGKVTQVSAYHDSYPCNDSGCGSSGGCSGSVSVWCGLCGRRCDNNCSDGTATVCPTGTTKVGFWTRCCKVFNSSPPVCKIIRYYDCCKDEGTHCGTTRCCNRPGCSSGTPGADYCDATNPQYYCTVYQITNTDC